jgi:hypothetical protein
VTGEGGMREGEGRAGWPPACGLNSMALKSTAETGADRAPFCAGGGGGACEGRL